jgi:pyruvate dehydrogenase E1 component beta subunit
VVTPSNPYDAKGLMTSALRHPDPVVFCEPKRIYRAIRQEVPEEDYLVPIGKAVVVREGKDATLVAWGAMVREASAAADLLAGEGIGVEVIDLRTLAPMDSDAVVASVKKTGRLVIAHEAPRTLGLGAEIAARVAEEALTSLLAPIERVSGYDAVMPLYQLENYYLPGADRIAEAARKVMSF